MTALFNDGRGMVLVLITNYQKIFYFFVDNILNIVYNNFINSTITRYMQSNRNFIGGVRWCQTRMHRIWCGDNLGWMNQNICAILKNMML